jgi:MFS family permease
MKAVRLYVGFQIFFSLLIWLPIFYEFQKRSGLDDSQIFAIQSIYYIAFCLLEIPTGLIADLWGYRRCMLAGSISLVVTTLLPIFFPTYLGFLAHFLLVALARSFVSGASSAYLYEYLAGFGEQAQFKQIEGNARAYGLFAKVGCWAVVGWLMEWKFTLPYWLTLVAALISLVYALRLPAVNEAKIRERSVARETAARLVGTFRQVLVRPYLLLLIVQGVAVFVLGRIIQVNLYQPILNHKAVALGYHGLVMSAMTVFEASGSARPGVMKRFFSDRNSVTVLTILLGVSIALMPFTGAYGTVGLLCVFALISGLVYPIQRHLFNASIPDSSYRATLLSLESIVDRAVCALVASLLAASTIGTSEGLYHFILVSGIITVAGMLLLGIIFVLADRGRET